MTPKSKSLTAKIGAGAAAAAIALVTAWEGYKPMVYADPIGRMAVCWGHDDQSMVRGTIYTRERCEQLLDDDLSKHADALKCIKAPLTDGQKAAFVSAAFNIGVSAFCKSSMTRLANQGDMVGACNQLDRWVYAGGKRLQGLANRRAAEKRVCLMEDTG